MDGSGTATARYTQGLGIDEPLEVQIGRGSYYYHADALGSITELTKSNGTAVNTYTYAAFGGDSPANTETVANPFHFTAREYDPETKLYYYRARYYDPLWGRFLSEDPIWPQNGRGLYNYVDNSPATFTDPIGLFRVINLIRQHRTLGIENVCGPGTGGACTIRLAAGLTCDCRCDGGSWKAAATLTVSGDLFVWNGPWPYQGKQPKDKTVHDAAYAIAHENNVHINPAIAALTPPIDHLEARKFKSEADCKAECRKMSDFVNTLFRAVLAATQKAEDSQ
jgi:RHS repeat-associated protein